MCHANHPHRRDTRCQLGSHHSGPHQHRIRNRGTDGVLRPPRVVLRWADAYFSKTTVRSVYTITEKVGVA